MKDLIKKILKEALGVPEGILESTEKIFQSITEELNSLPKKVENDGDYTFYISTNISISDYVLKNIILHLMFKADNEKERVDFYAMGYQNVSQFNNKTYRIVNVITPETIEVTINLSGPEKTTKKDIKNYFKSDKSKLMSALSHELGHAYNLYKKGGSDVKSMARYRAYTDLYFPIKEVNDFIYNLYYIHSVENIVRPIEVASEMKSGNINKENFYEFITNNDTYKKLKKINEFSYENFRNELFKNTKKIKSFLIRIGVEESKLETDEEIVDELLKVVYVNLTNKSISTTMNMMITNPMEELFGFGIIDISKEEMFTKIARSFAKYHNDVEKFFKMEAKNFKYYSTKMLKKISKLYAYEIPKSKKQSINDWDSFHKMNKTGEQIETKLRYSKK